MRNLCWFAVVLSSCLVDNAMAGKVTVNGGAPGTLVTLYVTATGYSPFNTTQMFPASGTVTFTVDKDIQDHVRTLQYRYVPASQAPASVLKGATFAEGSLPAMEPFSLPDIIPTPLPITPELAVNIDANAAVASQMSFTLGTTYAVTNGSIPSLPFVSIPGYTGTATVLSIAQFAPVPEPTIALLTLAGGGMAMARRSRR